MMGVAAARLGVVVSLVLALPVRAQVPSPAPPPPERPRLIVFLSVDQFRRDYVTRYGSHWTAGLARLVREGAVFDDAAYPYFHTITCAGHATMATGVYPATHGLPLNAWWDRDKAREVACTDDGGAAAIGHKTGPKAPSGGNSAHFLRVPTLADVMREQIQPTPRVVTVSMKPRAAIMLAGHAGDAVIWYTPEGGPTTSTAYTSKPIPFVSEFAKSNPKPSELTGQWTRLLPDADYQNEDDGPGENPPTGWTPQFPHPLTQTRTDGTVASYWQATPAADAWLERLATTAVDQMKLGHDHLDFLGISFSNLDATGHAFGPDSHEVQDVLFRLDRTIGDLLDHLDATVGKGRYVVALTGDHGVAPMPDRRRAQREDGGRINLKALAIELDAALSARWGKGTYVSKVFYTDIYFAPGIYARLEKEPEAMAQVVGIIERTPGVDKAFQRAQVAAPAAPGDDPALVALRLSLVPDRSGDIVFSPKPYWITNATGTTHGSPNAYDQQVPVVLFGAGIRPGHYAGAASPADLVPTLAALVGVHMPRTDGRVLREALSSAPVPTTP
jgi:predicted AlkP superfamily pyrophosphatase or phosphodiesterase